MSRLPRLDAEHFIRILEAARLDGEHLSELARDHHHVTFLSPKTKCQVTVPFDEWDISSEVARRVLEEVGISRDYLREILLDVKGY